MTRLHLNGEISLEISYLNGELGEKIYQAYKAKETYLIDTVQGELKSPACLISGASRGKPLWGLVFTASVAAPPHCIVSYFSDSDLLCCGYGLNLYCLKFGSGDLLWHHETEFPIQDLMTVTADFDTLRTPSKDSALYLISELAIEKLRFDGTPVWEYWHKEPIETVMLAQGGLKILDLEGGKYLVARESGKAFRLCQVEPFVPIRSGGKLCEIPDQRSGEEKK